MRGSQQTVRLRGMQLRGGLGARVRAHRGLLQANMLRVLMLGLLRQQLQQRRRRRQHKISKKAGKKNVENGKLPLNIQHRGHQTEGQIYPNAAFKESAIFLGYYEPLFYYKDDLNLSSSSILDIFNKIEEIIK